MAIKCPTCGADVTAEVSRKRLAVTIEVRTITVEPKPPQPVLVTCKNGHTARY